MSQLLPGQRTAASRKLSSVRGMMSCPGEVPSEPEEIQPAQVSTRKQKVSAAKTLRLRSNDPTAVIRSSQGRVKRICLWETKNKTNAAEPATPELVAVDRRAGQVSREGLSDAVVATIVKGAVQMIPCRLQLLICI